MIFEADIGNTALKWRLVDGQGGLILATQRAGTDQLDHCLQQAARIGVQGARISSVASHATLTLLRNKLEHEFGVEAFVAQTLKKHAGLTVAYTDPSRLGVDRWLAMLAAKKRTSLGYCVMDCGSAITLDWVDAQGQHRGGYIIPGLQMARRALLGNTSQIRLDYDISDPRLAWGKSTEEAINHGVLRTAVSLLESVLAELSTVAPQAQVFLTGGDGPLLYSAIEAKTNRYLILQPDLVLDGLAVAEREGI